VFEVMHRFGLDEVNAERPIFQVQFGGTRYLPLPEGGGTGQDFQRRGRLDARARWAARRQRLLKDYHWQGKNENGHPREIQDRRRTGRHLLKIKEGRRHYGIAGDYGPARAG